MVSRRNFFTITLIMLVVLFLFQIQEVMKDQMNNYGENEYEEQTYVSGNRTESGSVADIENTVEVEKVRRYIVYLGDSKDGRVGSVVRQWCVYTKHRLVTCESLKDYSPNVEHLPEMMLIDTDYVDVTKDLSRFKQLTNAGVNLVFCNLPSIDVMGGESARGFRTFVGIRYIMDQKVKADGIRLLNGFLIGGQQEYQVTEKMSEEDRKRQDLELQMPWYVVTSSTKVYMAGIVDVPEEEQKDMDMSVYAAHLPALIWRNNAGGAKVFTVNGDYLNDNTGLGILSSILAQLRPYDIYPVVNAQNLAVLNFPDLAAENTETMMAMYSQDLKSVYRDIVWPGLVSVAQQNTLKMSCMFMPQMNYTDELLPEDELLVYYMKRVQEQSAETGLSGTYGEGVSLKEKTEQDISFLTRVVPDYHILSFYQGNLDTKDMWQVIDDNPLLKELRTICEDYKEHEPLFQWDEEDVIHQSVVNDGYSHTFSEDLRTRSIETALGYSSIGVDVNPIGHPDNDEDSWEKLSEKFASNTGTYWKAYKAFEATTLAESDARIRRFLKLDYAQKRVGNIIHLSIDQFDEEAFFLLRMNGETVSEVAGGTFTEVEDNVYLICAQGREVRITVEPAKQSYYY